MSRKSHHLLRLLALSLTFTVAHAADPKPEGIPSEEVLALANEAFNTLANNAVIAFMRSDLNWDQATIERVQNFRRDNPWHADVEAIERAIRNSLPNAMIRITTLQRQNIDPTLDALPLNRLIGSDGIAAIRAALENIHRILNEPTLTLTADNGAQLVLHTGSSCGGFGPDPDLLKKSFDMVSMAAFSEMPFRDNIFIQVLDGLPLEMVFEIFAYLDLEKQQAYFNELTKLMSAFSYLASVPKNLMASNLEYFWNNLGKIKSWIYRFLAIQEQVAILHPFMAARTLPFRFLLNWNALYRYFPRLNDSMQKNVIETKEYLLRRFSIAFSSYHLSELKGCTQILEELIYFNFFFPSLGNFSEELDAFLKSYFEKRLSICITQPLSDDEIENIEKFMKYGFQLLVQLKHPKASGTTLEEFIEDMIPADSIYRELMLKMLRDKQNHNPENPEDQDPQ
jgi:hypothetical protein